MFDSGSQDACTEWARGTKLISAETAIPVIFITGRGDIPSTVRAMKGGAIDFLTKPIDEAALLTCIERALEQDRLYRKDALERASLLARYRSLTSREQQVLPLLVKGMLRKMEADSFATLVKLAGKLNIESTIGS